MKKRIFTILLVILLVTLCACSAKSPVETTTTTQATNDGLEDSIFNETDTEGTDDKSFSASVPLSQDDPTETTVAEESTATTEAGTTEGKTDETTDATTPGTTAPEELTYEEFEALSPAEKRKYQESFGDIEAFFNWYDAAKAAYEKEHPPIIIGGGTVTLPTD